MPGCVAAPTGNEGSSARLPAACDSLRASPPGCTTGCCQGMRRPPSGRVRMRRPAAACTERAWSRRHAPTPPRQLTLVPPRSPLLFSHGVGSLPTHPYMPTRCSSDSEDGHHHRLPLAVPSLLQLRRGLLPHPEAPGGCRVGGVTGRAADGAAADAGHGMMMRPQHEAAWRDGAAAGASHRLRRLQRQSRRSGGSRRWCRWRRPRPRRRQRADSGGQALQQPLFALSQH